MDILYLDNKIIVCVKSPGVLSVDQAGGMPELIRRALGEEDAPVYSVHRLDAAAAGLMVYARTRRAAADLGAALARGDVGKEYLAVLHGRPGEDSGTLRDLLCRDTRRGMTYVTEAPGRGVKEAVLDYTLLASAGEFSLVRVILHTGRTHQIRCQFSHRGHPLWGDRKYGLPGDEGPLALWSHALRFVHPASGEPMEFTTEPPEGAPWNFFKGE